MSTATKNTIVNTFKAIKHELDVCAELIDECVKQGTIK